MSGNHKSVSVVLGLWSEVKDLNPLATHAPTSFIETPHLWSNKYLFPGYSLNANCVNC
jgi:hypothetical protein